MKNKITYQPVQAITVRAVEDLPAFRFVSHLGSLCDAQSRALGVTEVDWIKGENASVITLGTIAIETSTAVNAGMDITSDAKGKAKPAEEDDPVNGRALEGCNSAGFIKIKIVP